MCYGVVLKWFGVLWGVSTVGYFSIFTIHTEKNLTPDKNMVRQCILTQNKFVVFLSKTECHLHATSPFHKASVNLQNT